MIAPAGFSVRPEEQTERDLQQISGHLWAVDNVLLDETLPYIELLVELITNIILPEEASLFRAEAKLMTRNGMVFPVFLGCQRVMCDALKKPETSPLNLEGLRYALESLIFIRMAEIRGPSAKERPLVQSAINEIMALTAAAVISLHTARGGSSIYSQADLNDVYHECFDDVRQILDDLRRTLL